MISVQIIVECLFKLTYAMAMIECVISICVAALRFDKMIVVLLDSLEQLTVISIDYESRSFLIRKTNENKNL